MDRIIYIYYNCISVVFPKIAEGGSSDCDFEDRFLQCFGLVDPVLPASQSRSSSGTTADERAHKLKRQSESSPWSVCVGVWVFGGV